MNYIPFHLTQIRGRLGKLFVIKKSKYGYLIKTKYPNMKHIKASVKQKERRDIFKQSVAYAKWLYADEVRKKTFLKTVKKRKHRAFQTAMKLYLQASPERQLNLKLTMLKSCLSQRKVQREAKFAKNNYYNQGPWLNIWPKPILTNNEQRTTNNQKRTTPSVLSAPLRDIPSLFIIPCSSVPLLL